MGTGAGAFPGSGFGFPGAPGSATGPGNGTGARNGGFTRPAFPRGGFGGAGFGGGRFRGFGGGLSGSTQVDSALITLLEADASQYRWIAATEGSQEAAPIELATGGLAVVAIGGFNDSDPSPTLAQFQAMIAKHQVHYFVGRGANSFGGSPNASSITSWVAVHYTDQIVGGTAVYDLTKPTS
jgi:hypothetical protein